MTSPKQTLSIIDAEAILPEHIITNDYFGGSLQTTTNKMFLGTRERRHIGYQELASPYLAQGILKIVERLNLNIATDIDMIITNVSIPDEIFTGCGAVVNKLIKGKAKWIIDMHNTGCVSPLFMIEAARAYMQTHGVKSAMIANMQTAAGRVFGHELNRKLPQSAIPGDGASVIYVNDSHERPVILTVQENFPDYSEDMFANFNGKHHWEPRDIPGNIDFNEDKSARIMIRGNKLVPQMVYQGLKTLNLKPQQISYLITNQPNMSFLRNWREALLLPPEKHLHSFEKYANLFGAGIGINLAEHMALGTFKKGDLVCLAGFAHAGDYAASSFFYF
jgi:3-oxoacyl-[acyl-carrier-protein] synthase-3